MDFYIWFLVIIVGLLFIYIRDQYKVVKDLDLLEVEYTTAPALQESCDLRQPFLLKIAPIHPKIGRAIDDAGVFDVVVADLDEYVDPAKKPINIHVSYQCAESLFSEDEKHRFFSENNEDFLEQAGLIRWLDEYNPCLRPPFYTVQTSYDFLFGSVRQTPLTYHTHFRRFLLVLSGGKIRVRFTPWKNAKYLDSGSTSHLTPDSPHLDRRVRFCEMEAKVGELIYIPPYVWYSIEYLDRNSRVASFSYKTVMNIIANLPQYAKSWLKPFLEQRKKEKEIATPSIEEDNPAENKSVAIQEESVSSSLDPDADLYLDDLSLPTINTKIEP